MSITIGERSPLLIIAGPTAVGKTAVSIALAKRLAGECVSADSVQVYKGLDIGSAKTSVEEQDGVPHFLIDVLDPSEEYNVALFQEMASKAVSGILERGHLPILVGGTGFYIQALLYGINFYEESDVKRQRIRQKLESEAEKPGGPERLYQRLMEIDPASTTIIHPHNLRRVIRALEFFELNHSPISLHNEAERKRESVYDSLFFVITDERKELYQRIDARVDRMMEQGFLSEVESLIKSGIRRDMSSMQGIGYKELAAALSGELSLDEAVSEIKKHSRNYAKRQITWFKRERDVIWVDRSKFSGEEEIVEWIIGKCSARWA